MRTLTAYYRVRACTSWTIGDWLKHGRFTGWYGCDLEAARLRIGWNKRWRCVCG